MSNKFELKFKPQNVLEHLQDEESKFIYENRMAYNLSRDYMFIKKIVDATMFDVYRQFLDKFSPRRKILFGAGACGKWLVELFGTSYFKYAVDSNADKISDFPIKIISFDEFIKLNDDVDVIISTYFFATILPMKKQLISAGIDSKRIIAYGGGGIFTGQYFDLPQLEFQREVFVDAGSYNLYTSEQFLSLYPTAKKIVAFEPDPSNFELAKQRETLLQSKYPKCEISLLNCGLSDKSGELSFTSDLHGGSFINVERNSLYDGVFTNVGGNSLIKVTTIDEICPDATFIKMDIEGSELDALKGAKNTIVANKPKLAISVYHKSTDLWEIPALLLEYNPDYKFYLRHYSCSHWETVLYAIQLGGKQ